MKKINVDKLVKWFCRQINFNEFASAMAILMDVFSGSRKDIEFKQPEKPPHYRRFNIDQAEPLTEPPCEFNKNWQELQEEHFKKTGKDIAIVKRRSPKNCPPEGSICAHCHAPGRYLYLNGSKSSQLLCKVCGSSSPTHKNRITPKSSLWCPYCKTALYLHKVNSTFVSYKCGNRKCSHYLDKLKALTPEEKALRESTFSSQFKLHYQFRVYNYNPSKIKVNRPTDNHGVDLRRIHNDNRTLGLILSSTINFGLGSRTTKDILKHFFNIDVSHQTIINYVNATAYHLYEFIDNHCPKPQSKMAADETYISVLGKWFYTWFGIDFISRAICGFGVSDSRGTKDALAFL